MKKLILPIVALMGMAAPAFAETTTIGYVSPGCELTGDNGAQKKDVWSSGAIFVPASTLHAMPGAQIKAVKAGIQSKLHIDGLKVWIRQSLDGENLAEGSEDAMKKGWMEVSLDTPWTIPADITDGIYIGYSVHQTGMSYCLSNTSDPTEGGYFVNIDEEGWKDMSADGTLCLEAIVEGDNLPATNLSVLAMETPKSYVVSRGTLVGNVTLKNHGVKPVGKFNVSLLVDGIKDAVQTIETPIVPGGVVKVPFILQPRLEDESVFNVSYVIDGIDSGDDANMEDNSVNRTLEVLALPVERVALIEEFTTEKCPNCPSAANLLNVYSHDEQFVNNLAIVAHHAGYYTDQFTNDFDVALEWYYGSPSTYAPAMMLDRYVNGNGTPVSQVNSTTLERNLVNRIAVEPRLGLDVNAYYDEDDNTQLHVKVEGKKYSTSFCENPAVTIYLCENNIASSTQASGGANFVHQHVARATNSTWGDQVDFDKDGCLTYEYTFTVSPNWKKENLEVVAFVHNKNTAKVNDNEVENAAKVSADNFKKSGVNTVVAEAEDEVEYYTLDGMRVFGELAPGLYVRKAGEAVTKILVR